MNAALIGASGSNVRNNLTADAQANIGAGVHIVASDAIAAGARNEFYSAVGGDSATGAAGGVLSGSAAISSTAITSTTTTELGAGVDLESGTDPMSQPGGILLDASTIILASDRVQLTTGGAIAGAGTNSSIDANVSNNVRIGTGVRARQPGQHRGGHLYACQHEVGVPGQHLGAGGRRRGSGPHHGEHRRERIGRRQFGHHRVRQRQFDGGRRSERHLRQHHRRQCRRARLRPRPGRRAARLCRFRLDQQCKAQHRRGRENQQRAERDHRRLQRHAQPDHQWRRPRFPARLHPHRERQPGRRPAQGTHRDIGEQRRCHSGLSTTRSISRSRNALPARCRAQ